MMKGKFLRLLIGVIFLVGIIAGGAMWYTFHALSVFADGACKNHVITEVFSPDHRRKAVIFEHTCGVIGGRDGMHVSILGASENLSDKAGNAFALEGMVGRIQWPPISVEWNSPFQATISYDPYLVVTFADRYVSDTSLFYKHLVKP